MRIDNDFLTLLDLTVRIERVHQMTMVGRPVAEQMRLSAEIDRMKMDRDALVAKINAADDARRKEDLNRVAAMFKLADWHDRKRSPRPGDKVIVDIDPVAAQAGAQRANEILRQIDKVLGGRAGEERDAAVAMLLSDLKQSRATIDAITADLKKREARMVEVKDAAPEPTFEQKLREFMAKPSQPKGHQVCVKNADEAEIVVARYGRPDSITIEHNPTTVFGGIVFVLRWNVSPKDAGEGR